MEAIPKVESKNIAVSNGFYGEMDLFKGAVPPRKCQCGEPGCDLTLEKYRADRIIHPLHRAAYNKKLARERRQRKRKSRIYKSYANAESYHVDYPELMDALVDKSREWIDLHYKNVPWRLIWNTVCFMFREKNYKINDHWESWYRDQVEEILDGELTFRRKQNRERTF